MNTKVNIKRLEWPKCPKYSVIWLWLKSLNIQEGVNYNIMLSWKIDSSVFSVPLEMEALRLWWIDSESGWSKQDYFYFLSNYEYSLKGLLMRTTMSLSFSYSALKISFGGLKSHELYHWTLSNHVPKEWHKNIVQFTQKDD